MTDSGLDEETYGGAFEAGIVAQLTRCSLHTSSCVEGGYQRLKEALPAGAKNVSKITITRGSGKYFSTSAASGRDNVVNIA